MLRLTLFTPSPGKVSTETGGRPAKLMRFRREVLLERAISGARLPVVRSA